VAGLDYRDIDFVDDEVCTGNPQIYPELDKNIRTYINDVY
jgi:hypothetical protein